MIKAADKALKDKDSAIKAGTDALNVAKDQLTQSNKDLDSANRTLNATSRNPFVLLGSGTAAGALIAVNLALPGIGILMVAGIAALFKL